ncbi:hypothetical protein AAC387_Pa07g1239 [Persea americana]
MLNQGAGDAKLNVKPKLGSCTKWFSQKLVQDAMLSIHHRGFIHHHFGICIVKSSSQLRTISFENFDLSIGTSFISILGSVSPNPHCGFGTSLLKFLISVLATFSD